MQPQYSQGAAPSHHPPAYAPPEVSQASGGSITSSLRQWRKKDYLEKQQPTDQPQTVAENPSHVARVAPHTYYPRLTNEVCHYQHQYSEYGVPYKPPAPTPVKYSEIVDNPQAQTIEHITPVIPKLKDKEFGDLCSVPPQPHLKQYQDQMTMKQSYPDGTKQTYSDPTVHHQYISKESQIHPFLQKQSQMHQYIQKESYQQFLPKYSMQGQYSQSYPSEPNNFLAHLNKINPRMAQSIINDTHLRDPQIPVYHALEQNRSYSQGQRMYHGPSMHSSPTHAHRNIPQSYNYPQPYNYNVKSNMQPNDPYNRVHQYQHNVPKYLPEYKMNAPIEQPIPNISPQRMFNENVHMTYAPMPPKISPNYPHCSQLEYAQHYQHRRAHLAQEFYAHSAYKSGYVQNPQISPEGGVSDGRTRKSSLKQYLETWVEENIPGNLPDLVVSSNNLNDVENMENLKGTMCIKGGGTQEQPLYVLDTTEIPNENLPHFLHLQQFEKLPDNIRGYYQPAVPGTRRIIIENNSSDSLPENNQIIRDNSAPIVPNISDGFTDNSNVVAIVNQSAAENQRKIVNSGETSPNMRRGFENQIQNLENKVVQIHILEESEASTNSNDITATVTTHQRTISNPSDTVIIQSNVYQHNPLDSSAKIIDGDESCVIKKHSSQIEEENSNSSSQSETKVQNEDGIKNMPVIDESITESTENEVTEEEIFIPPKDAANVIEEVSEDVQACETVSSRRSSICSIYKEMEHIHGENISALATNNFESTNIKKSSPIVSENVSNDFEASQIIPDQEENGKKVCNTNSDEVNDLQQTSDESCIKNIEPNEFEEELNAKDKHSKLETIYSQTSENCDASNNFPTDLTNFVNPEIPVSKDKIELSESTKNQLQETALENENHRQISKKLRTAKVPTPTIVEECPPTVVQELLSELKQTNNKINSATDFLEENVKNLEDDPDTVDLSLEVNEVVPLLLNTKEMSCTENEDSGNTFKTILQIPKAKILNKCAINYQSGSENFIPTKEPCFNKIEKELELSESSEEELPMLDQLKDPEDMVLVPIKDIHVSDDNNKNEPLINTSFENTCHQIDDFVSLEENIETTDISDTEKVITDKSSNSNEEECVELEKDKNIEQESDVQTTKLDEIDDKNIEHCEETVSKDTRENFVLPKSNDDETFLDESFTNYMQTTKPLNLSVEKKSNDNKSIPTSTVTHENCVETSPTLYNQTEKKEEDKDPLDTEFARPENLSLSVTTPTKLDTLNINHTLNIKSSLKRLKSKTKLGKKESIDQILSVKEKLLEDSKSEEVKEQDVIETANTSSNTSEPELKKAKPTKHVKFLLADDIEDTLKQSNASDVKVNTPETKLSLEEEIISKSDQKSEMPELTPVSESKSKLEEIPNSTNSWSIMNTEDPTKGLEVNDTSNIETNPELSEATMPVLKCMVKYDEKLKSSSNDGINFKDPLKSINYISPIKIRKRSVPKFEHSKTASEKNHSRTSKQNKCMVKYDEKLKSSSNDGINFKDPLKSKNYLSSIKIKKRSVTKFEHSKTTSEKNHSRTSKQNKYRERIPQRHSDLRRKSRRLTKNSITIHSESKAEQETSMPHLVKESMLPTTKTVEENLQTEEHIMETESNNNNVDIVGVETAVEEIVNFSKSDEEAVETTDSVLESKTEENIETVNNYEEEIIEQSVPSEEGDCEEPTMVLKNVTEKDISIQDEPEKVSMIEQTISNEEEDFQNNDPSIVYQINDTNVVLQIADELLEINVTTQNGRKIISVKTFSDAVIMNTSEEPNSQVEETCVTEEPEETILNPEVHEEKLCENETPLNNNYLDNTSNLKNTNTDLEDEANFCFKEICTATDITVADDVFIYNEEVVSSSTEIEAVTNKEEQTKTVTDDKNLSKKYITRKTPKKEKKVSWKNEENNLDKIKCLNQQKSPKEDTVKVKVHPNISESSANKSTTPKDSLRKSPKTKAALKFVETVKTSKPKIKESKVPSSKPTDTFKPPPVVETNNPDKNISKTPKKPVEQNIIKEENLDSISKNIPKQKYRSQNMSNKNKSHNKNKDNEFQIKIEIKSEDIPKIKEKTVHKNLEKPKEINIQVKNKRSLSPKEEKQHHNKSLTPKKKPKIDKPSEEPQKTKVQSENKKKQKEAPLKNIKKDGVVVHSEIIETSKVVQKEIENKKNKTKSSSEEPLKTRLKQKSDDKIIPVPNEEPIEEVHISVQENSITSSTSQETEALIKQRGSKLIQQITDDWDDDSDDLKSMESSSKRRLSLQEYNNRKRTNSTAEQETQSCDVIKPDLTDNLFNNVLIANKSKREISPESPVLSVKFNNKTYSRSSSMYNLKCTTISNNSDHEQDSNPKETTTVLHYKTEPLSSAIELHLPKINRSPRPTYNQEYLRNALMHDLQAVNAYTTSLIKENQQLMQRFLEQKRLTTEELKKVKTIIRYKRLVQHLSTIRINEMQTTSTRDGHPVRSDTDLLYPTANSSHLKFNPTDNCDVNRRQSIVNQITKINQLPSEEHVKVNLEKRKKKRFRFLYSDEETEPRNSTTLGSTTLTLSESLKKPRLDDSVPALDHKVMDYSVHQSNSQGQLTLVFKRSFKSDPKMQPFVKLERLPSIDLLAKNRLQ